MRTKHLPSPLANTVTVNVTTQGGTAVTVSQQAAVGLLSPPRIYLPLVVKSWT